MCRTCYAVVAQTALADQDGEVMAGGRQLLLGAPGHRQQFFAQRPVLDDHEAPGFVAERAGRQATGLQDEFEIGGRDFFAWVEFLAGMTEIECVE